MASQRETLKAIRAIGLKASCIDGEYRVTFKGLAGFREEAVAHYTNDANDALDTARAMIKEPYGVRLAKRQKAREAQRAKAK